MPVLPMNASAEPRGANKGGHRNAPLTIEGRLRLCLRIDAGRPTDWPSGAFACFLWEVLGDGFGSALLRFSACRRLVTVHDPCGMPVLCVIRRVGA